MPVKGHKSDFHMIHYIVPAVCIMIAVIYLIKSPDLSVGELLDMTPRNPLAAAVVLLLLYAFKSITIFLPLLILEITVGHLFSHWIALLINLVGLAVALTIPYWIGHFAGIDAVQKLVQKYPKFETILGKQKRNSFFLCFFLRIIGCLPGDVVTMYMGATQTPYLKNLIGGLLGLLPGMVLATFIGESIQDPQSPMFWISVGLKIVLVGLSVLLYYLYRRRVHGTREGKIELE